MDTNGRPDQEPPAPAVSIWNDSQSLMQAAAQRIATLCEQAVRLRGRFTWALAGGSTPRQLYSLLASVRFTAPIDWSRVDFFWGDERCVPPSNAESNYRMARETLLDAIAPDPARVHRMMGEVEPADAAMAYERQLHDFFAVPPAGPSPSFDLVLLGMGADGHTASLFPGTAALNETQRWVVVNRLSLNASPRLSLTFPILNAASHVLFLVSGPGKAACLKQVLERPPAGDPVPAQRVRPRRGQLEWMVDADAASRLRAPT